MTTIQKNGVEIVMPDIDKPTKLSMERCADFLARMIQKYGSEILSDKNADSKGISEAEKQ